MPPPSAASGRAKRPATSDGGQPSRARGRGKAAYKPPRPSASQPEFDDDSRMAGEEDEHEGALGKCQYKLVLLKGLYSFWLQLLNDTGLGWNEALGTVVATDDYWECTTKGNSLWKQLRKGPPDHEELLQKMFGGVVVDGSGACVPGQVLGHESNRNVGGGVEEGFLGAGSEEGNVGGGAAASGDGDVGHSPAASGSLLHRNRAGGRGGSQVAITSPLKGTKNPMVRVMKNIHATLEANCAIANKVMLGEHLEAKIKEVLDLTVECGASEGSAEHFMATCLFNCAENRATFKALKTNEARLLWLKRHCAKEGLMDNDGTNDEEDMSVTIARGRVGALRTFGVVTTAFDAKQVAAPHKRATMDTLFKSSYHHEISSRNP
ncbi:hypothetical protein PR202_gb07649 [Eleusine coracana subsp. coracana]|uniref:Myb/SANT-like domain-containing protein n=1 Tax=Eleusine coracana subsp. coracana TaxID=191504 RepID=A0AAV5EDG7_ELECO|nr:hypothetical protein PR202_gb07649 [Eleusine coracana subsp. coracana]